MVKEKVENETNGERFIRIATKRTNRILDDLRLLKNCSNRKLYTYTPEQIKKIFSMIEQETKHVRSMFENSRRKRVELR